jgi:steroid delta-isomerase-like uncharacterized protein
MAEERLKDLTRKFYDEVLNRGNLNAIDDFVAVDLIEHQPAPPGAPSGREGMRQYLAMIREGFPDSYFEIKDMVAEGDKVWIRSIFHGTNTGSFMGMPATRKTVEAESIDITRFSRDKMAEHWGVYDQFGMLQQMGLVPAAGEQHG